MAKSKKNTLIIGGTKGIGKAISTKLRSRGDQVFTFSRSGNNKSNNFKLNLLNKAEIKKTFSRNFSKKKIDNLIFTQRYRGKKTYELFETDLFSASTILSTLKKKFKKSASVIFISSISNRTIVDDQSLEYHIARSGIEQMMRFYAAKFSTKKIRFNCILPSKIITGDVNLPFPMKRQLMID